MLNRLNFVGTCENKSSAPRSILNGMKSMLFVLLSLLFSSAAFAMPLSNELPKELVNSLLQEGLWEDRFDQDASSEARDLRWFWHECDGGRSDVPIVVDQLFGSQPSSGTEVRLPRLYPVKIHMIRYLKNKGGARVQAVSESWMRRYLEVATSTLDLTNAEEIKVITERFRQRLRAKQFQIVDLSAQERARLAGDIGDTHHGRLLAKDNASKFVIAGAYSEEKGIFALDFARPLEETLITFAHEMVHAADPALDEHRRVYKIQFPKVIEILSRWLASPDAGSIAVDIVDHVFFETSIDRFQSVMEEVRSKRMEQLKQNINTASAEGEKAFEPSKEEIAIVRAWLKAAIGLTVENEYRAYGYSVLAYGLLKSRYHVLPPSIDRQRFVERFLAGDGLVAAQISVSLNPFLRARSTIFQKFFKPAARANSDVKEKLLLLRVGKILDQLELIYLEETEKFLRSLNDRISSVLRKLSVQDMAAPSVLSDWAKPDGFDLPSNPFQVLTVRLTTASALRFRQNMDLFVNDIMALNKPLQTMRIGILDLSDITVGERKLIGVNYADSPWTSQPKDVNPKLAQDLDSIPADITKYFSLAQWKPTLQPDEKVIDGKIVAQNLVRLRTIKATVWLDYAFPSVRSTILGVKSYLQRIRDGIYSADELSVERAKELEQELIAAVKNADMGANELVLMRELLGQLHIMHKTAEDSRWTGIASLLQDKIRFVVQSLDYMGISTSVTVKEIQAKLKTDEVAFYKQISTHIDFCRRNSTNDRYRLGGYWPEKGPFRLGQVEFPLTIICYNSKLHLLRQPDDYMNSMTTLIRNEAPEARIFNGSRPIRLYPITVSKE